MLQQSLLIRFGFAFLVISCMAMISMVWYTQIEQREIDARRADTERFLKDAELLKLRQQLQPHFLFNSLNSISALTGIAPDKARDMINQLSEFLRGTLKKDEKQLNTLKEEIQYLELYLDIEKVRFGHRLQTNILCDDDAQNLMLPAMILQPVVENAIKFGLYDTTGDVLIRIHAKKIDNVLEVIVQNPYDAETSQPLKGTGFGLASIQRRLFLLFARNDLLKTEKENNQFITTMNLITQYSSKYMNVVIIDDEPLARSIVKEYLQTCTDVNVLAECSDGFEGLKAIQQHQPDLIFLDIQMPKINGFEMLELIETPPHVIFTTAFDEYAIKAFENNAVDYLLKPFSKERFNKAIQKYQQQQKNVSAEKTEAVLESATQSPTQQNRVVVKDGSKIKIIPVAQIQYLEAADDYVKIFTAEGSFLKKKTMNSFEQSLQPFQFVRVHRSYIVNTQLITRIDAHDKENHLLILNTGAKLPVSKAGYAKLKEVLGI